VAVEVTVHVLMCRYGPVAISIDASLPTFRFYSEGEGLRKTACGSVLASLQA